MLTVEESSEVVEAFLSFARNGEVKDRETLVGVADLVCLLRTWECQVLLCNLLKSLRVLAVDNTTCPLRVFILASQIDDTDLAAYVLRHCHSVCWMSGSCMDGMEGKSKLDPTAMPRWALHELDDDYLWTLQRTHCEALSADTRADAFKVYLEAARARHEAMVRAWRWG